MVSNERCYELHINLTTCEGCNICQVACPINAETMKKQGKLSKKDAVLWVTNGKAFVINQNRCNGCGVCIKECPQKSITMTLKPLLVK